MRAITRDDIQAAAQQLLHTDQLVWLVVGKADGILSGDAEHGISVEEFGTLHMLPKRDPLTDAPIAN